MGGSISAGKNNDELVDNLVEADYLKTPALQHIFRAVDRGDYYAEDDKESAYRDSAYRHGNLHLSAPCVYSEVMEALRLQTGLTFLNLGSGSGYLSTLAGLILGPHGINHGVELFEDVVDFAYCRLETFMSKSEAVDAYEFCEPRFVRGNCLKIDSSAQLYDRVYCGAACPEEHEVYMKHLIKIGGILVMPLNNKLLQIIRTGETTWSSSKVLSVSFAPLLTPTTKELIEFVNLPDITPPRLQELCRSKVRTVLRQHIDTEHPSLLVKKTHAKTKNRRQVRRIVIPIIDESESGSSNSRSNSDNEDNNDSDKSARLSVGAGMSSRATAFIENFMRGRADIQEVVAGPSNWRGNATSSSNSTSPNTESRQRRTSMTVYSDISNSDMNTDDDEDKSHTSDSEILCSASFVSKSKDEPEPSDSPTNSQNNHLRKRQHSDSDQRSSKNRKRILSHPRLKLRRRTATVIWKHVASGETNSESETEEKAEKTEDEKPAPNENEQRNYTILMREKIKSLPLPMPLRHYMNYRRSDV